MFVIDNNNYLKYKDFIIDSINKSEYISVDCEFSNLLTDKDINKFDSLEEIYYKSSQIVKNSLLFQFGFTCVFNINKNNYNKRKFITFCCYLFNTNGTGTYLNNSIKFLSENNFDFIKLFKHGIPFKTLFSQKEDIINTNYNLDYFNNDKFSYSNNGSYIISDKILSYEQELLKKLIEFIEINKNKNSYNYNIDIINDNVEFIDYIKSNNNKIKSFLSLNNAKISIKSKKITFKFKKLEKVNFLNNENIEKTEEKEWESINNFSEIIYYIMKNKKPLIFHNPFFDLLYIFNSFIMKLPENYNEFLFSINKIFSNIFDTKYLANNIPKKLKKFYNSSLFDLYKFFEKSYKFDRVFEIENLDNPEFIIINDLNTIELHNSGYDSLLTSYIFFCIDEIYSLNNLIKNSHYMFFKGINHNLKINDINSKDNPNFINNSIIFLIENFNSNDIVNELKKNYSFTYFNYKYKNQDLLLIRFKNNFNKPDIKFEYIIYEERYNFYKNLK